MINGFFLNNIFLQTLLDILDINGFLSVEMLQSKILGGKSN